MKQMRSRFRLITLLLVCAFLLTLVLCVGSMLKKANVTLSSISTDVTSIVDTVLPESSVSPETSPAEDITPAPSESHPDESVPPVNDSFPKQEYNIYGL